MAPKPIGFWSIAMPPRGSAVLPNGLGWVAVVLACLLNAVAMAPMAFLGDGSGVDGPTREELWPILATFVALPPLAVFQPWIGLVKVLRLPRLIQVAILLPLLFVMGALGVVLALGPRPGPPLPLALAAAIASLTSGLMQWWLWRWQAETRISRG